MARRTPSRPSPSSSFGAAPAVRRSRDRDLDGKIRLLMAQAADDRERPGRGPSVLDPINIRRLPRPGGGERRIFRILLTNACRYSCIYCPMQRGRDIERHALAPERLVAAFLTAHARGWAEGLFVTTAIPGDPIRTADRLLALVESLRFRHEFPGYVHVKLVPGAEDGQVRRLARLCNRVSYNLEFACGRSFEELAPEKSVREGVRLLRIARGVRREGRARRGQGEPEDPLQPHCRSGATTQFVVGPTGEDDALLLRAAAGLAGEGSVHHVHFAAFRPIHDTPLEGRPETPVLRENRLYQAEHLVRDYGFSPEELPYDEGGRLPLDLDPKEAWAEAHPERFPVELLTAARVELLRIPGIGAVTAGRIVERRRTAVLTCAADVWSLGVARRAAPWLTLRGRLLGTRPPRQMALDLGSRERPHRTYAVSPGTFR